MKSSGWNKKRNVEGRSWKACVCGISKKETWSNIIVGERVDLEQQKIKTVSIASS
jgi:hypothetical protein